MAAPTVTPGGLSSNWKILQQRLAASASSSSTAAAPKKRKASAEDPPPTKKVKVAKRAAALENRSAKPPAKSKTNKSAMASTSAMTSASEDTKVSASLALWAEDNDIPAEDLARAYNLPTTTTSLPDEDIPDEKSNAEVGKYIAMDCEMVGVGGPENERSALARVSIVNYHGHCVFDCFVKPKERVTDWRTWVSGVSPACMKDALTFEEAQQETANVIQDRILVGHAISNDLGALLLSHPRRDIRDTSRFAPFRKMSKGRTPGLKKLAKEVLGIEIQGGEHSSIEDARACMLLYRRYKDEFEKLHAQAFPTHKTKQRGAGGGGKKGKSKKKKK